jgi:hypothetical protein
VTDLDPTVPPVAEWARALDDIADADFADDTEGQNR